MGEKKNISSAVTGIHRKRNYAFKWCIHKMSAPVFLILSQL
jgi:hypothetical protein